MNMNDWIRAALGVLLLTGSLGFAEDHTRANAPAGNGEKPRYDAPAAKKISEVETVTAWDPNMEAIPGNTKEGLRLTLAFFRTQINKIKADPELTDKEKADQTALIEEMMRAALVSFRSVTDGNRLSLGAMICPGGELSLINLIPKKFRKVKPSAAVSICAIIMFKSDPATGATKIIPTFGFGGMTSVQLSAAETNGQGKPARNGLERQTTVGFIFPLTGDAPKTRVGDIQGYYMGAGAEAAVDTNNTLNANEKSKGWGGYVKVDGLVKPEVAIALRVVSKNDMTGWSPKGEAFYLHIPYAMDGTEYRQMPFLSRLWQNDGNVLTRLFRERTAPSKHSRRERLKAQSNSEILQLIEDAQEELKKSND